MKPLHRGWWGHSALGSTLRVFSEAAGEAAELGETGPDHGLEHQVGGGGWRLGVPFSVQLAPLADGPCLPPSPEALAAAAGSFFLGPLRKSAPLPARSSQHPHVETRRVGPDTWGGLAQLLLPRWLS